MSKREERLALLQEACESVNAQTVEDLQEQSLKVAGNIQLMLGGELLGTPEGFITAVQKVAEATLMWLLAESYVQLLPRAIVGPGELAKRAEDRDKPNKVVPLRDAGAYI